MSRSYPSNEPGRWRMYCDTCDFQDPDRFVSAPPLEHFVKKGWFIGVLTDRCPDCYRRLGAHQKPHSAMSGGTRTVDLPS